MSEVAHWHDDLSFPVLLRIARAGFSSAIRAALAAEECTDLPRNGIYVLGAIARYGTPLSEIIKELGVSKQAAGQLVDTLVVRGYLDRSADPDDRRRMTVGLTERGRAAAVTTRAAIDAVEAELVRRVGADDVTCTRNTLAMLSEIERMWGDTSSDHH